MKPVLTLFFRAKGVEYSMEAVFDALENELSPHISLQKKYVRFYRVSLWNLLYNSLQCFRWKTKINHITGQIHYCALLLPRKTTIVTVHDVVLYKYGIKRCLLKFFWFYLPLRHVDYITCISQTTKRELLKLYPFLERKIWVIYNPVNDRFQYTPKVFARRNPVILCIGTRVNKNLERVIEALKGVQCHLRIIGKLSSRQIDLLHDCRIDYSNSFHLTNEQIVEEYKRCDIVSFVSVLEGFGMPIIEGQAIGRVVLTSNIDPMMEVANGSALLVNPFDISDIRTAFLRLIQDEGLRESLIEKGLVNVQRFRASQIAQRYLQLYNHILK